MCGPTLGEATGDDETDRWHGAAAAEIVALSVHGPAGVLDLVVPTAASAADVAVEYARQAGLGVSPALFSRLGRPLPPDVTLADAGIASGDVLAAGGAVAPARDGVPTSGLPRRRGTGCPLGALVLHRRRAPCWPAGSPRTRRSPTSAR